MTEIFGAPIGVVAGQIVLGLINGSFYALLSLGLAIIFGMLNVLNFAHGALYMMGGFVSWMALHYLGISYWPSLILSPLIVACLGIVIERFFLRHLYQLDHLYGLLFTFGAALAIEGLFRYLFGSAGKSYPLPTEFAGGHNLGFVFLPWYRLWVIGIALVLCFGTWFFLERTKLGSYLRAATENPRLVQAFGINVPLLLTLTYAFCVALAGFAGALAAPIYQVTPNMGSNLIIIVFAVVVIGGMGSILGTIITGLGLGVIEGLTKLYLPTASAVTVFIIMIIVLMFKPSGLFGQEAN